MIDLSVKDLVKSFDADTNLLDGVSFDIQAGERVRSEEHTSELQSR